MKLRNNISHVKTNTENSTPFTIKTSAKAFKILSDNLYSDKITAVIRELSCNAYDSHIEAGKEKTPFEIHLPIRMQPWLSIRDYGVGMSHDDIMSLYTAYFDSNKTNSNEVTGVLGLGSKSPFAYTDMFTVESIYENKKRLYSCFINKDGTPNITLMDESDTEQSNGIEVKMSVEVHNCEEFKRKAIPVLSVFKTKPKVTGVQNFVFDKTDSLYSARTWQLKRTGSVGARAIQGNVTYSIESCNLNQLSREQCFVAHNRFDIYFNIGDLDIAASREALSYDDTTIENIGTKLDKVYHSFHKKVTKQLNARRTLWEAKLFINTLFGSLLASNNLTLYYKGKKIDTSNIRVSTEGINTTVVRYAHNWRGSGHIARHSLTGHFGLLAGNDVMFIVNDENRKGISKARNLVQAERKTVYLIKGDHKSFLKAAGNPPFVQASSLPVPIKASNRFNGSRDYKKIYMPIKHSTFHTSHALSYDELPINKKLFYMATKRGCAYKDNIKLNCVSTQQWVDMAHNFNIISTDVDIYGISTWNIKNRKIDTKKQFVEFFLYVENKLKNKIKKKQANVLEYNKAAANYNYIMAHRYLHDKILQNEQISSQLDSGSKFFDLKHKYNEIIKTYDDSKNNNHMQHVISAANKLSMNKDTAKHDDIERVEDVYPMIAVLDSWDIGSNIRVIIDYIKLIDRNL